jgi:hypothetical protein
VSDAEGADNLVSTLGTGDALLSKVNSELKKQGLKESTGVMLSIAKKPPVKPGTRRRRRRRRRCGGGVRII